jgi:hypothetical protein
VGKDTRDIIREIEANGPRFIGATGSHHHFKHAVKPVAAEALAGHFAAMRADGETLPVPGSFEDLKRDAGFIEDSADAIVTTVTPRGTMAAAE